MIQIAQEIHLLVPLGADLIEGGAKLGEESDGRHMETSKVYNELTLAEKLAIAVVSAGFSPKRERYPRQSLAMADLQKETLLLLGIPRDDIEVLPYTWGTLGEIRAALNYALAHPSYTYHFHVMTHEYHVDRAKWICNELLKGYPVTFHPIPGGRCLRRREEIVKCVAEMLVLKFPPAGRVLNRFRGFGH